MSINKLNYRTPEIVLVPLDREISLALESAPPAGPDEGIGLNSPEHFNPSENLIG